MVDQKSQIIVLFGRTGSGKSSLGNKLLNLNSNDQFKESASIISETKYATSATKPWIQNSSLSVTIVDTPGFGDNRLTITKQELLTNTFKFLKEFKAGFNLSILCINAQQPRIDGYEFEDFVSLGRLLGKELFDHSIIALTQTNKIPESEREKKIEEIKKNLPLLLADHGLNNDMPIYEAGWESLDDFSIAITKSLEEMSLFKSDALKGVNLEDPEVVEKWLQDPKVTQVIQEKLNAGRILLEKELEDMKKTVFHSTGDLAAIMNRIKDFSQPAEAIIKTLNPPGLCILI